LNAAVRAVSGSRKPDLSLAQLLKPRRLDAGLPERVRYKLKCDGRRR